VNASRRTLVFLATLGSAGLLGGAFLFEILGYAPCRMCIWQRWPHAIAIAFGVLALTGVATRSIAWAGAAAVAATSAIGFFHAGVELGWWAGPASCSGGGTLAAMSADDLLSTELAETVIMCDEVVWSFLGLSMAAWNGILSLALVFLWALAARPRPTMTVAA
jgi:disulfide bond formation protein DsbB